MKIAVCFHRFQFNMESVKDIVLPAAYYPGHIEQSCRFLVSASSEADALPMGLLHPRLAGERRLTSSNFAVFDDSSGPR